MSANNLKLYCNFINICCQIRYRRFCILFRVGEDGTKGTKQLHPGFELTRQFKQDAAPILTGIMGMVIINDLRNDTDIEKVPKKRYSDRNDYLAEYRQAPITWNNVRLEATNT